MGGGLLVILLSVLLISIGVTYAYFNTVGSTKKEELSLSTGTMSLAFNDGNPEINGLHTLNLGESITKKFTIENTGTLDASLSLDFNRLYNTYMDGSLTYKLEWLNPETEEYEVVVNETNMPVSSTEMSHPISTEISVPTNMTYDYNLVITFNSTEEDQTSDMNATFYTYFNVAEPLKYRKYKLNVDLNGGSWTKTDEILPMSHNDEAFLPSPTKEGYTFIGWNILGSGSSVEEEVFKMGITDTKVTAKWEPINYTVTIDKGDGSTPITVTKTIEDNKVELPSREEMNNLKEGYEFSGWEVTGGEYSELENTFTLTEYKNASISAIWTPRNYGYTINYRKQNISNPSEYTIFKSITDKKADYGTTPPTPETPTEVGFGTPQVKSVTIGTNEEANIINVDYPRNKYMLYIDPNGGSYSDQNNGLHNNTTNEYLIQNIDYEDTRIISEPIKEGYTNNWELTGENSSLIENTFTMGSENARLIANWTPIASIVTLNANGGVVNDKSEENIIVLYDSTYGELPEPTKEGYKFLGWYTSQIDGTKIESTSKVGITENQTLYAYWEQLSELYQLINAAQGGSVPSFVKSGTPDYTKVTTETDADVYTLVDDYGISYYYRGNITNNYIKFGKWADTWYRGYSKDEYNKFYKDYPTKIDCENSSDYNYNCSKSPVAGKDIYWRIMRINGDGTIRIVYDGTSAYENSNITLDRTAMQIVKWNNTYFDAKYVGYMFGGAQGEASTSKEQAQTNETSSNIKIELENWYKINVADMGYDDRIKIADRIFCNDRSTPDLSKDLGYGNELLTYYGAYDRFITHYETSIPTFKCDMNKTVSREVGVISNDAFTSEKGTSTKGNGDLLYPIGLLTADEVIASGIQTYKYENSVKSHYLYKGDWSWLFSPGGMINIGPNVFYSYFKISTSPIFVADPDLAGMYTDFAGYVNPVINLTAEYAKSLIGDGTMENPYREVGMTP